eukprot:1195972-Prorocentrum_minimum.AAC.3
MERLDVMEAFLRAPLRFCLRCISWSPLTGMRARTFEVLLEVHFMVAANWNAGYCHARRLERFYKMAQLVVQQADRRLQRCQRLCTQPFCRAFLRRITVRDMMQSTQVVCTFHDLLQLAEQIGGVGTPAAELSTRLVQVSQLHHLMQTNRRKNSVT